ncbi:DUF58 domain-containing protein [Flammeovirgaceae bacterium SG7u.111]|nr:DUF58 domain-containing protein [Flammeovirgaceae bacterium SG7u.132]WPO38451.1 DUF58 domain-containing protein [Flammeovirgaceae bacterium SG7u.111]
MNIFKFYKNLYLPNRFFYVYSVIFGLLASSFAIPFMLPFAQTALVIGIIFTASDCFILFNGNAKISAERSIPDLLSLGDENPIKISITNNSGLTLSLMVIDELPYQLQERDFFFGLALKNGESQTLSYKIRPTRRGEYHFNKLNVYSTSVLGLVRRRHPFKAHQMVPVFPSVLQMKKYELFAFSSISRYQGIKKIRRLGHNYEFEQIKNYVRGDDYRSINWKASGRRGELMVNQYQDERAQQVYSVIDKSRAMRLPFNELTLLDYSINTSLMISNVALHKHDKAGLITFSDKIGAILKADYKKGQLHKILQTLYNQEERNLESNYELLYYAIRNTIKGRSLLFLYSNFESIYAAERALPILRKLNKLHLLVIVFFENSEIEEYGQEEAKDLEEIYLRTIAQKFTAEKTQILQTFNQYGIQTILTKPQDLSINTLNKYLELKSRGLI